MGQQKYNTRDGWWPMQRPPPYASDDVWGNTVYDFNNLKNLNGETSTSTGRDINTGVDWGEYKSSGCGNEPGVCYLEFRLEQSPSTLGMCWDAADLGPPSCPNVASPPRPVRAFAVSNEATSLWRCDLCTPLVQPAIVGHPMACEYEGFASASSLTASAMSSLLPFLSQPAALEAVVASMAGAIGPSFAAAPPGVDLLVPLEALWSAPPLGAYDPYSVMESELSIWNFAVKHPQRETTMICTETFRPAQQRVCDPTTDARRQALGAFAQSQYRETNGVWLQTVPPGHAAMWRSNVAHSKTGRFTVLHADGGRGAYGDGREVMSEWLLGDAPCSNAGKLVSRICVRSDRSSALYAMHPWVGGDFNPFSALDVCPWSQSSTPMCPCVCHPEWACTLVNRSLEVEFPTAPACSDQRTNAVPLFDTRDDSDVCNMARYLSSRASAGCTHHQVLFGSPPDSPLGSRL